jgi:replicative DNA helicase
VELIQPIDFHNRASRETYSALVRLHSRDVPPDATLLLVELSQSKKLSVRGPSVESVFGLLQLPVTSAHLPHYCAALLAQSHARQKALELVASSNVGGPP